MVDLAEELGLQGVKGNFEGASDAQIDEVEKQLKSILPDEYREFLRKFGASIFTEDVIFSTLEPSPWAVGGCECFDVFYGVSSDPRFDIGQINSRLEGAIPKGAVAIGHDSGSNLILIFPKTNAVQLLDRETGKTYQISIDFDNFLKSFHLRDPRY